MNNDFYKKVLWESPMAYAYHRIICDEAGIPCDYEFLEVNDAFESFTGLRGSDIIGRRITEIAPGIRADDYDWVKTYGEIAMNGGKASFTQFSVQFNRWYGVTVYSPERYLFVTCFADVSEENAHVAQIGNLQKKVEESEFLQRTDRERAKEEIQASEEFLSCLLDSIPVPVFHKDAKGRYTGFNRAYEDFYGKTKEELIGKSVFDISPPRLAQIYHAKDKELLERPGTQFYESQVEDAQGLSHDFILCKASLVNAHGETIGLVGSMLDITQRKHMEEELLTNRRQLSDIIEFLPDATLAIDREGRVIIWNRAIEKMTGIPAKEMIGMGDHAYSIPFYGDARPQLMDLVYRDDDEISARYSSVIRDGDTVTSEAFCPTLHGGKGAWVYAKASPLHDQAGNIIGTIESIRDITVRKQLEADLSKDKHLLETTLRSIGDGVISTDDKGVVVLMNRVAESLTGWTQEAAAGKPIQDVFDIVDEFTLEKTQNIVLRVLDGRETLQLAGHSILLSEDGCVIPIEESAAPIIDENGKIVGAVLVFSDYTTKKQKQDGILYLSYHDPLTGLYNRRFYEEELLRRDTARNLPLSIVMGDVNRLKQVNDSFGHVMGDELLKKTAEVIKKSCRADDMVARLGGDEFVVLLPKTTAMEAEGLIARIRDLLSEERVCGMDISISFGYCTKDSMDERTHDIFEKAEGRMYQDKIAGRTTRNERS
jgi:diguanylate cyclase